ncbi:MAG: hypothetical protein CUN55_02910 [Phototrophicales bacterium]|nr:MAG: hypothetical protein CUN55_02910 [Phototrophicales bacterium]
MSETPFKFRSQQWEIINYSRGMMGVSAVPGSGKTFTLSHLAAQLVQRITERNFKNEREVLIVTFTNSAVNSFKARIAKILKEERGLLPYTGYRVRTLHGLAHDIVRERPGLVGLSEDFNIVDERTSQRIQSEAISAQWPRWAEKMKWYFDSELNDQQQQNVLRRDLPQALEMMIPQFISRCKANRITPAQLLKWVKNTDEDWILIRFAAAVYDDYQRSLMYRGAVDFDDLVHFAILALESEEKYLERLRQKWPYILEDEAQDSSRLQEEMLNLLANGRNWVRVGDTNQAINTTFTTADPSFLRRFLAREDVIERQLTTSGRSAPKIIHLANELLRWTIHEHPVQYLREQTFYEIYIQPTEPGDAQQNPDDALANIYIQPTDSAYTPEEEIDQVVSSLVRWYKDERNRVKTVAVLVPENSRGYQVAERLRSLDIEFEELLRSTSDTRQTAKILMLVLDYLTDPRRGRKLANLYRYVWLDWITRHEIEDDDEHPSMRLMRIVQRHQQLETLLWPVVGSWQDELRIDDMDVFWIEDFERFLVMVKRWLEATILPIDQLILTIGGDIFREPTDIALTYKIAAVLKGIGRDNPSYRLVQFTEELRRISNNERRFLGFDDSQEGYEPTPGKVTISTMHAAKGLEWDRVYLMSVNNYSFPSALNNETYIGERWFLRDQLNLEAEIIAQLEAAQSGTFKQYKLGDASQQSRVEVAAERLRLLYVGITRARSELIITWNMGRYWDKGGQHVKQAALPLYHLCEVVDNVR